MWVLILFGGVLIAMLWHNNARKRHHRSGKRDVEYPLNLELVNRTHWDVQGQLMINSIWCENKYVLSNTYRTGRIRAL